MLSAIAVHSAPTGQDVVKHIYEQDRFGNGIEGVFPLFFGTGHLLIKMGVLNADGKLVGQLIDETQLFKAINAYPGTAYQQEAIDLRSDKKGRHYQRRDHGSQCRTALDKRILFGNGFKHLGLVALTTRRGCIAVQADVTDRVPEKTLFTSFHYWEASGNELTNRAFDPITATPEYNVSAAKVEKISPREAHNIIAEKSKKYLVEMENTVSALK